MIERYISMQHKKSIYLYLMVLAVACQTQTKPDKLLFYGQTTYSKQDTLYHTIQNFRFMDQDSNIVTNETFKHKVYVADFFFTSCPTICPIMKKGLLQVYQHYEDNEEVAILSHTIDPEYDTVPLLKNYAQNLGVQSHKWKFVTGTKDDVYAVAKNSYMITTKEDATVPGGYLHSGAFILIDKKRRIRGIYDGTLEPQVADLIQDIKILLNEKDE